MKGKNIKILLVIIFLILLIGIIVFIINNYNKRDIVIHSPSALDDGYKLSDKLSQEQTNTCRKLLQENIIGTWQIPSNESSETITALKLLNNGTFELTGFGRPQDNTSSGTWEFNKEYSIVQLKINKSNFSWNELLADTNLKNDFKGIEQYDKAQMTINFYIGYFPNPNKDFDVNCEINRFYINLFNNNLYKIN